MQLASTSRRGDERRRSAGHRVLIVDTQRTFAEAVAARLRAHEGFGHVATASDPRHALAVVAAQDPDVVLLDGGRGRDSWLDLLRMITAERPDVAVLMLSDENDRGDIIAALDGNARGWISKHATLVDLVEAVEDVLEDRIWLPREQLAPVLRELLNRPAVSRRPPSFVDGLTERQLEVLECLAAGMSRQQIADHLVISPHTVRTHVQDVLRKANVRSALAALALAREAGHFRPGSR